jgi:hypothetical protein
VSHIKDEQRHGTAHAQSSWETVIRNQPYVSTEEVMYVSESLKVI